MIKANANYTVVSPIQILALLLYTKDPAIS
jgi:hypothetical protein